ncbi:prolactin receptor-like isoform X1 [Pygocentrus nattereri]|uniref:Fibronectin type-III domain-containing protein n=1 Tax=Pygocentrus nattereri TaxID=42514 RepID=A0A3B4C0I0_PYGNA|nr:prolactin receptor-like isoform X1 [Pygocentrus nattereri]
MLRLLFVSLCWSTITGAPQETSHSAAHKGDATRPYIHYCRSPSMETFTCWWHPLDNGSQGDDNVTYSLLYTIGKGPPKECPDYVSGGPNSCYFDMEHTLIWEVYCMNVTAHSHRKAFTSQEHCLDVADIVEIDPPFNLTYTLMNISNDESGRTALVSWQYPIAQQVHIGWITLIYELRFRPLSEPNNWKVKERLREPHLELLDLPVGSYEVQVRCRSKNNNLWSKWSSPLTIIIPARRLPDRMLYALILVTGIGVTTLLIIGFGVIPQGKRIKAFLLPPIPKPRIRGIDPTLLKKGKMDEINRHFSSLHGYKPPQYCEETWYQVSMDEGLSLSQPSPPSNPKEERLGNSTSSTLSPACPDATQQLLHTTNSPAPYCQGPAVYGEGPTYYSEEALEVGLPPESQSWVWPASSHAQPELVSFPGMDYSMILNPAPLTSTAPSTCHDFYTCVNGVTPSGAVHLVPCVSNPLKSSPYLQLREDKEEDSEKSSQLVVYLEKQAEAPGSSTGATTGETEQSEFAVPLLPHLTERS